MLKLEIQRTALVKCLQTHADIQKLAYGVKNVARELYVNALNFDTHSLITKL